MQTSPTMKILLVCSSGGHFTAMLQLRAFWEFHQRVWVTFKTKGVAENLQGESSYWAYGPTNRHLLNLIKNAFLAVAVLLKERPDMVISTGAGVAVPFLILGKLLGAQALFIESITRTTSLSLSAQLVLPFAQVYVQWPQLQEKFPKTIYTGVVAQ
jgi:beta-1,4-N-acetylglucosaminyltransferase